jgi:hypothetical protein
MRVEHRFVLAVPTRARRPFVVVERPDRKKVLALPVGVGNSFDLSC